MKSYFISGYFSNKEIANSLTDTSFEFVLSILFCIKAEQSPLLQASWDAELFSIQVKR